MSDNSSSNCESAEEYDSFDSFIASCECVRKLLFRQVGGYVRDRNSNCGQSKNKLKHKVCDTRRMNTEAI